MTLSDSQIDFILLDVKKKGVSHPDLQEDLADHIICLIEKDFQENNFNTAYQNTLRSFGSLKAIQNKTLETIQSSGRQAILFRFFDYLFTLIYFLLGITLMTLPVLFLVVKSDILVFTILLPMIPIGWFLCFTRIDYKKFELIPFKTKVCPEDVVFY